MNAAIVLLQTAGVGLVLFGLFRARKAIGLAPLYVCIGVLQVLQAFLAGFFVEVMPGVAVSVGSTVLFPATLSAILAVYIREDAVEARKLIYGLVIGNLAASALSASLVWSADAGIGAPGTDALVAQLAQGGQVLLVGTLLLFADAVLVPAFYETVASRAPGLPLFAKILVALGLVLVADALIFSSLIFGVDADSGSILRSAVLGRGVVAVLHAAMLATYLTWLDVAQEEGRSEPGRRGAFAVLTYRERFEKLREVAVRDALTGLLNRGYFDESLEHELASGLRYGRSTGLLLVDADHFKRINDRHGHQTGDVVLRQFARILEEGSRDADIVCRYGGEEFAVVLPSVNRASALALAERLRRAVEASAFQGLEGASVTCSIGVSIHPEDGPTPSDLVAAADARLYAAKAAGRNRVLGA
jgi:diguanylate cyclase (GGDEF)-like protein